MTALDDREKAFEKKFVMDEEEIFKVNARAVKRFGLWAAKQIGLAGADADVYADQVMDADFDEPGSHDFMRKVQRDFAIKGMNVTIHHLENEFNIHLDEARVAVHNA